MGIKKGGTLHLRTESYHIPVLNLEQLKRYFAISRQFGELAEQTAAKDPVDLMRDSEAVLDEAVELIHDLIRVNYPDVTATHVMKQLDMTMMSVVMEDLAMASHGMRRSEPGEREAGSLIGDGSTPT